MKLTTATPFTVLMTVPSSDYNQFQRILNNIRGSYSFFIHYTYLNVLPIISRNMGDSPTYVIFFGNFP